MDTRKRNLFIVVGIGAALLIAIGVIVSVLVYNANKNPYGESVSISGYDEKVKNLPEKYKDSITAALLDSINNNSEKEIKSSDVTDAAIRSGSDKQDEIRRGSDYTGSFIVDIPSLRQSYTVQYSYSADPDSPLNAGYPVLVDCVPEKDVIYDDFKCIGTLSEENAEVQDPLVSYLPYSTLSYKVWADITSGDLEINADLRIPSVDLSGDEATRRMVVAHYKKSVTDWITSKDLDASRYTINYNYSDTGELLR